MEANEAIRRIFWRHRWLLLVLMIVSAVAVVAIRERQPVMFAATATVQGQSGTPDADTQVSAIQSRVAAVATDPAIVQQAITAVGVVRDPTQVARHEVAVTPLGSSAVMVLTVSDRSKPVAIGLTGALAQAVVNQLNQLGIKDNPELGALNKSVLQLTAKRDKLVSQLDNATLSGGSTTSVQAQSLLAQLSATEQQLATDESTSQQVLSTLSANTGASVISTPSYASEASRHVLTYAALAALLGLLLGLLFGALREIIRPTVAQPAAGARELGGILMGNVGIRGSRVDNIDDDLAGCLSLAANRARARTVVLTGPISAAGLTALASRLNHQLAATAPPAPYGGRGAWPAVSGFAAGPAPVAGNRVAGGGLNGDGRRLAEARGDGSVGVLPGYQPSGYQPQPSGYQRNPVVVAMPDVRLDQPADVALVVVLPPFTAHSALDRAADLGLAADWPILGVIGLRRHRRRAAQRASSAPDTEPRNDGTDDTAEMERIDD